MRAVTFGLAKPAGTRASASAAAAAAKSFLGSPSSSSSSSVDHKTLLRHSPWSLIPRHSPSSLGLRSLSLIPPSPYPRISSTQRISTTQRISSTQRYPNSSSSIILVKGSSIRGSNISSSSSISSSSTSSKGSKGSSISIKGGSSDSEIHLRKVNTGAVAVGAEEARMSEDSSSGIPLGEHSGGSVRQLVSDLVALSLHATFPEYTSSPPPAPVAIASAGSESENALVAEQLKTSSIAEGEGAGDAAAPVLTAQGGGAGAGAGGGGGGKVKEKEFEPLVQPCNNPKFGDYQCNNAMGIWSRIKGASPPPAFNSPAAVGQALQRNLPPSPMVASTSIAGPGFVNILLSDEWLARRVQAVAESGNLSAWAPRLKVSTALVDFSSPNIAKEMHVGHLRSTIIGDTLARMLEYCGVEVLRRNHVGDWGTQFGMLIEFLFEQFPGDWETAAEQRIGDLQAFYKAAKKKFDEDLEFKDKAQKAVVKLQGGDTTYRQAWAKICDISRKEFDAVYKRLDIRLEERGESFYNPHIPAVLERLRKRGLVVESDGAQCIWVEGHKVPLIAVKSDGGFNYATTDLTCLWYRLTQEKAQWVIYVTDVGQAQHFDMFLKAAKMAGWLPWEEPKKPKEASAGGGGAKKGGGKDGGGKGGKGKKGETKGDAKAASGAADAGAAGGESESASTEAEAGSQEATAAAAAPPVILKGPYEPDPEFMNATGIPARVDHVGFGLVLGEDGKRFRTRSSEVVRLVDLLDEAVARARQGLLDRGKEGEWSDEEINAAAAAMGYGAVKYADLKNNRLTNYVFDFDQMLDMKGNTAVYLLYAHARICSIIRKSGKEPSQLCKNGAMLVLASPSERALALDLCRFPEVVESAIEDLLPNALCEYLYNLSGSFTGFYTNCQVIGSPEEDSRLILCEATAVVMRKSFDLLGITPLYRL